MKGVKKVWKEARFCSVGSESLSWCCHMLLLRALFGDKVRSGITGHGGLNGTSLLSQSEQMVSAHFLGHANVHFVKGISGFDHHPPTLNYSKNRFSNLFDTPFLTPPTQNYFYSATVIFILVHCQTFSSKRTYNMGIKIISRAIMSDMTLWRDESERTSQESRTHHKTSSSVIPSAKPRHLLLSLFRNKSDR